MTQEEFDALEEQHDFEAKTGGLRSLIDAHGPVRVIAFGLAAVCVASLLGFGAVKFLDKAPRVAVSEVERLPQSATVQASLVSEDPAALPPLPSPPAAVAALAPAPIREIENVEPTQANSLAEDPADVAPGDAAPGVEVVDCDIVVEQSPLAGAMIALDIAAPCDGGARADIFQGDLQVAYRLDDEGSAQLEMPALSAAATVAVVVDGRTPVSLIAKVSDIDNYNRAVLFWQDKMGLKLHAFEADADFGDEGHVGADTPKSIARALSGNGGYLMALGDSTLPDPQVAVVYTSPADMNVLLSVEAPVSAINCGQDVYAGTIQGGAASAPMVQDLMFTMPGCDTIGDSVFLSNVMEIPPAADANTN